MSVDLEKMLPSNNVPYCAVCGIPISRENDSGWEIPVGKGKYFQPICCWCEIDYFSGPKEKEETDEDKLNKLKN